MSSDRHVTQAIDLPTLPEAWHWKSLNELVDSSRGICYGIVQPGKHDPTGVPMVNTADVFDGSVASDISFKVSGELHSKFRRSTLKGGELLVTLVGANFGRVAIAPSRFAGYNCSRAVGVVPVVKDPAFVMFALRSPLVRHLMDTWANTTAQPTFNLKDLGNLPVPIPPETETGLISDFLSTIDDRINLLRETNATLEAIAQALFKSWFIDFDPVRAKMAGRVLEGMDEATAALFPDSLEETELGLVPKGWRTDFIAPWLSVLETGRRPKGGVGGISDGIPSIGAESIVKIGQFDFSKLKFVSNEFFAAMKSGRLTSRDVLLYKDGGKPGVFLPRVSMFGDGFPFDVCGINEHVFRIRLKEPFGQVFLYFWLWSDAVMHELKHRGGKAAIPGINQADVKELRLSVPSEPVLRRFEEICDPIVGQILNNAKRMQNLALLRDGLLPRLISGQLRLPEAQAQLEAALA
jgi:type I restriction enzyme, S subunit